MSPSDEKKALRQRLIAERKSIGDAEKALLDAALCQEIASLAVFREADCVLGFLPIRGEPDLTPLLSMASTHGKQVALPRCEGGEMRFLPFSEKAACTPDQFGILAPRGNTPEVRCTAKTLCLLPGLAATADGKRLGYGGGFYDRFLRTFPGHTLFALYHSFLLQALPCEPFDLPVEIVITEKGVILP